MSVYHEIPLYNLNNIYNNNNDIIKRDLFLQVGQEKSNDSFSYSSYTKAYLQSAVGHQLIYAHVLSKYDTNYFLIMSIDIFF